MEANEASSVPGQATTQLQGSVPRLEIESARPVIVGLEQVLNVTDVPKLSAVAENLGALTSMANPYRLSVPPLARSYLLLDAGVATLAAQGKTS